MLCSYFFVLTGAIIAGKVGLPGDVCGIVVSFREWGGTIAVWNSNSADAEQLKRIEVSLSQFSSHHICYQPHKVSMQINKFHIKSKYRKNNNNNRGRYTQCQPQQLQQQPQYLPPYYYQQQQLQQPPQPQQSYFSFPPFHHQQPYNPQLYPGGVPARAMPFHPLEPQQPQQPQRQYPKPIERPQHNRPVLPPPGFDCPSQPTENVRAAEEETKQEEVVPVVAVVEIIQHQPEPQQQKEQHQEEEEDTSVGSEGEDEEEQQPSEEKMPQA